MSADYEIHPDMNELIAAKEALTRTTDAAVLKTEWDNYGIRLSRPYPAGMVVKDETFNCPGAGHDGKVKVRIYRPKDAQNDGPCVIFLHGGGFIKGSLESADSNAWGVAHETSSVVISIDYRLAPDFPYPAAIEDTYESLRYIVANAKTLGIDKNRIAYWGESAGAAIAASASLMARDKNGPKVAAQVLIYGAYGSDLNSNSYVVHANSVGEKTEAVKRVFKLYLGGKDAETAPYAFPLKSKNLKDLPPAFIHYAEIDPLADDSPAYAEKLTAAGVPATLRRATGMIHGFIRARFSGTTAANEFSLPCMYLRGLFANSVAK